MGELDDELAAIDEQLSLEAEVLSLFPCVLPCVFLSHAFMGGCIAYPLFVHLCPSSWENLKCRPTFKTKQQSLPLWFPLNLLRLQASKSTSSASQLHRPQHRGPV